MSNIKHAVISAAGLGSRLGMDIPKCLITINGKTLIDRQLELLRDVPNVRVVVGFKEHDVINHVGARWSNVTFVRNPEYARTTNTHSLELGAKYINQPFIALDGDLVIDPNSFLNFLDACDQHQETIVGISKKTTEDAVGVLLNKDDRLVRFLRPQEPEFSTARFEWCGVAYFHQIPINSKYKFVYQLLAEYAPLRTSTIQCAEIETPRDLDNAVKFCSQLI